MKLKSDFYRRPCLDVARDLVGKVIVFNGMRLRITETEAYCGESDTACHAHKGRTKRTQIMYRQAGTLYIYLCYGMHWLMNIVTGEVDQPEAVLIRACAEAPGPGRLTKAMGITGSLNGQSACADTLWLEDDGFVCQVVTDKRVGIGYASQEDQDKPWRFIMQ